MTHIITHIHMSLQASWCNVRSKTPKSCGGKCQSVDTDLPTNAQQAQTLSQYTILHFFIASSHYLGIRSSSSLLIRSPCSVAVRINRAIADSLRSGSAAISPSASHIGINAAAIRLASSNPQRSSQKHPNSLTMVCGFLHFGQSM